MTGATTSRGAVSQAESPPLELALLEEYGGILEEALRDYLPAGEPRRPLYDPLAEYPLRGGKRLRPCLCIASARAFGARLEDVLETAVAIELFHSATLVHDDIEDGSEVRRGYPTMHQLHGVPLAINIGDALSIATLRPLIENRKTLGTRLAMRIVEETERMARETAEGQAIELGWRRDNVVELEESDYLEMVLKKTCWLLSIHPCRVGALIGTRDRLNLDGFVRFGFFFGAAFQIQDDLLNLVGDGHLYGKEISGDLWEGKRTLMLIRLLQSASPSQRRRIRSILARPRCERRQEEIVWMRELMDRNECIEYARQIAHGLAGAALHEYSVVFSGLPESRDLQFIRQLVVWMVQRAV